VVWKLEASPAGPIAAAVYLIIAGRVRSMEDPKIARAVFGEVRGALSLDMTPAASFYRLAVVVRRLILYRNLVWISYFPRT
jgi:hypothetical protein